MNYLFIGGPSDGARIALTGYLPQVFSLPTSQVSHARGSLVLDHTDYHLRRLVADSDHQYVVYVHESLTPDDAMRRLLESYSAPAKNSADRYDGPVPGEWRHPYT